MYAAKSFPTGFAGDIQKQPLQWGLSGPQLQDARCRMWLFHTHCLAFFGNVSIFLPCLLFNRNCTLALWLCTLALKMFEAVPRCSAFTGVVSSDSWSSPCLRCAWPQITCLCSTVMSTTGNWHSFFMSHLTHLHLKRNIVQLTVYFHYCAVDWIVLQIFFKPFVTEVTMPCSCFLPYPSICWQAWHVWCLFLWPLRLLWLTSWCNWLLGDLCCSTFALHKRFWVQTAYAVIMAVMNVTKKPASLKRPKKRLGKAVLRCSVHHARYCFGIPFLGSTGKALVHWACLMFAAKVEEVQNSVQAAKTLMDWLRCLAVTVLLVL